MSNNNDYYTANNLKSEMIKKFFTGLFIVFAGLFLCKMIFTMFTELDKYGNTHYTICTARDTTCYEWEYKTASLVNRIRTHLVISFLYGIGAGILSAAEDFSRLKDIRKKMRKNKK